MDAVMLGKMCWYLIKSIFPSNMPLAAAQAQSLINPELEKNFLKDFYSQMGIKFPFLAKLFVGLFESSFYLPLC